MDIHEKKIPFDGVLFFKYQPCQFLNFLHSGVYYLSAQNDCFRKEFQPLWGDISRSVLDWGTRAFGHQPDAVNLWLGNDRAVSSLHKDFYENLYVRCSVTICYCELLLTFVQCVVTGTKHFTLLPPTDIAFLKYVHGKAAAYDHNHSTGKWEIKVDEKSSMVPWYVISNKLAGHHLVCL